ncbi:AarF/UbiB family protein [Gemmatimonadota bacterium]
MTWIGFVRLLRQIYGRGLPDIEWIERQGLLAVKIGQIHALRIDFLDQERCQELARLFRHTERVSPEGIDRLLETYLDEEQRAALSIDRDPLASASVGQVHRATLSGGEEVVVKLIKSDVRDRFLRDVRNVRRFLRFVLTLYPRLRQVGDPLGILEDVRDYTVSELDLNNEIDGHRTLGRIHEENADRFDLSALRFARVHEDLSNENVMVSEYIPGRTFDELLDAGELRYEDLLRLFKIHMFYVFGVGTFHGDIHPGNIILHEDHLYFVDTGYIGTVGDKIRKGLFGFMKNLAHYRFEECAFYLNQMADGEISGPDYEDFKRKFLELYADFEDTTVAEVSLTTKMMHTIKLGVRSGMIFERGIFPIIRSLMYLDGMVLRCRPEAVLMRDMRPFLEEGQDFDLE